MKTLTTTLMVAAAALAAVAGSASAQTLKAEIPFNFRVGNSLMAPGTYRVAMLSGAGGPIFTIQNLDTNRSAMLGNYVLTDASKAWKAAGIPKLAFACVESHCSLQEAWSGGARSYRFQAPKAGRHDDPRLAEISMTRVRAD